MQSLEPHCLMLSTVVALILIHKVMRLCSTMKTSILLKTEFSVWVYIQKGLTWPFYLMLMLKSIQSRQSMASWVKEKDGSTEVTLLLRR